MSKIKQMNNSIKYCRDCDCELVLGDNWTEYSQKYNNYICTICINKKKYAWAEAHPEKVKVSNKKWRDKNTYYRNNHRDDFVKSQIKYKQSKKGKVTEKKYRQSAKYKKIKRKAGEKFKLAHPSYYSDWKAAHQENIKKANRKAKNKRRYYGNTELYPNPFTDYVSIRWHHVTDEFIVAIPRDLHELYTGWKEHRELCMNIVNQIYLW